MTKWAHCKLGDICDYVTSRTSRIENYISTENILPDKGGVCAPSNIPSGAAVEYKVGDILISNIRPYFQKIWQADCNGACSADVLCIRANNKADSKYLYYLLSQQLFFDYVMSGAKGCKMPRGDKKQIMQFEISLPSLEEQRRIAGILGAIDDKIENNRRINTNLELQAQALYKQWFVDNRNDDWEGKPLSEIAEFIGGYSYKGNELVESSSTAMATIKNFERKGGFKVDGFKDIVASSKLKAEQHAELFDILVAHTDLTQNADVIGNAEILLTCGKYSNIIFSMDLVKVLPKSNFPYKYLLAALLKNPYFKAHCLGYVNGTTVLHMSKKALPEYVVACPPNSEAEKMDMAFKAYYHKMAEILQENEHLATLRDTLLPKLMNGEIKVAE